MAFLDRAYGKLKLKKRLAATWYIQIYCQTKPFIYLSIPKGQKTQTFTEVISLSI